MPIAMSQMSKKDGGTQAARKRAPGRRKAPTTVSASRAGTGRLQKQYLLSLLVAVVVSGASIGIGVSDAGQIDVPTVIKERNQKVAAGETPSGEEGQPVVASVPVQNSSPTEPNGGLRGAGDPPPSPPPNTSTSTATTSEDGSASSTVEAVSAEDDPDAALDPTDEGTGPAGDGAPAEAAADEAD